MRQYLYRRSLLDLAFFQKPPAPEKCNKYATKRHSVQLNAEHHEEFCEKRAHHDHPRYVTAVFFCRGSEFEIHGCRRSKNEIGRFTSGFQSLGWSRPSHAPIKDSTSKNGMQLHAGCWSIKHNLTEKKSTQIFTNLFSHCVLAWHQYTIC